MAGRCVETKKIFFFLRKKEGILVKYLGDLNAPMGVENVNNTQWKFET